MTSAMRRRNSGFTLIELLVVIGVIAVLVGTIGLALRPNNPDSAVRSGQGMMMSALSAARGQAALNNKDACLVVNADPDDERFLRLVQVVVKDPQPADPDKWKPVGTDVLLPENVYIVPPVSSTFSADVLSLATENGPWPTTKHSSLFDAPTPPNPTMKTKIAEALGVNEAKILVAKAISSLGRTDGGYIVVAPGRRTGPTSLVLDRGDAVRGLTVSRYGVAAMVNEASSFE